MKQERKTNSKYRKNINVMSREKYQGLEVEARAELIQQLIPLGLLHVQETLIEEVRRLAGAPYSRGDYVRYGSNPGSVILSGQRLGIQVPRVRDKKRKREVPLESYQRLHADNQQTTVTLERVLKGISCRDYESAAQAIPGAFGISASSVSRQFIKASAKKLKQLQERDLSRDEFVAMWLDGKAFSKDQLIVAVGLTMSGKKVILGFIETATENKAVTQSFLEDLLSRGMDVSQGILVVVDGAKGLNAAIEQAFKGHCVIQRCQWHKRENVVSYVSKGEQSFLRKRLQKAYERPTYDEAKRALNAILRDLENRNLSAQASLKEGLEETLSLHRLGVFPLLGKSLKTTNVIESINSLIEQRCGKVDYWKNSSQRQRWLAASLLDIEPRLRRAHGYRHLEKLRMALQKELNLTPATEKVAA